MDEHQEFKNAICESHPELCFERFNGKALMMKKKMAEGLEERQRILEKYLDKEMIESIQDRAKELCCKSDDIMDAVCLAATVALKAHGICESVPENPDKDARGIAMQMIVPKAGYTKYLESQETDTNQVFEESE